MHLKLPYTDNVKTKRKKVGNTEMRYFKKIGKRTVTYKIRYTAYRT